jgi:hypothetical protein
MTRQPRDSCSRVRAFDTMASVYAFPPPVHRDMEQEWYGIPADFCHSFP